MKKYIVWEKQITRVGYGIKAKSADEAKRIYLENADDINWCDKQKIYENDTTYEFDDVGEELDKNIIF